MEPTLLASLVLSVAILIAGIVIARSDSRARGKSTDSTGRGDDFGMGSSANEIRAALERIDRRLGQLEQNQTRRRERVRERQQQSAPLTPATPAPLADGGGERGVAPDAVLRENKPRPIDEIRRLAERGRDVVEIAQLVDADIGEVELVLGLDRARGAQR